MKKLFIATVVITAVLLSSCDVLKSPFTKKTVPTPKPTVGLPDVKKPSFTLETYPKIDGSTATIPLSEAIASSLLGISAEKAEKFVKHNQTHEAYVNLIGGKADIIFVTEPSADELKLAKDSNVELEVVPVVKEGFVFLVNRENPVNSLTTKQIQDIYQGKIKNWKDVGGADKEIIPYQRDKNSGSQTLMEQKVMKGLEMMPPSKDMLIEGMGELIEVIHKYDNSERAIGYSVYYYAKTMYNRDNIKLLAVDGVKPDDKSISSDKYPFTSAYYAVLKKTDAEYSPSRQLLKWLLGAGGQEVAKDAGYVPVKMR